MTSGSVHDVIPLKDLEKISNYQEQAVEMENRARLLETDAQKLLMRAEGIVDTYREKIRLLGWEACKAEAEQKDMISWWYDPLPGAVRS
jgi:hypothetical protein